MISRELYELPIDAQVTITAYKNKTSLDFKSTVKNYLKENILIAEICNENNEPISFYNDNLYIELVGLNEKQNPIIWKDVIVKHITYESIPYHCVEQKSPGKVFNRRNAYRIYVGKSAQLQKGLNSSTIDVILRNISATGFSFVTTLDNLEPNETQLIHIVSNLTNAFTLNMMGFILRKEKLENGKYLYAGRFNGSNKQMNDYIMQKQKEELRQKRK